MKRSTKIWVVILGTLFIVGMTGTALRPQMKEPYLLTVAMLQLFVFSTLVISILPSLVWCIVLVRKKRWRDVIGLAGALLLGIAGVVMESTTRFLRLSP
jgi:hypothetical protein